MKNINLLKLGGNMFVIVVYDVSEYKNTKVRKILKKYLTWIQNSVFEGTISELKLNRCMHEVLKVIDVAEDSIYIYKAPSLSVIHKKIIGIEKNNDDMFL